MSVIRPLSDDVVNKIAAGEIIQVRAEPGICDSDIFEALYGFL
jgi:hypothetical protein